MVGIIRIVYKHIHASTRCTPGLKGLATCTILAVLEGGNVYYYYYYYYYYCADQFEAPRLLRRKPTSTFPWAIRSTEASAEEANQHYSLGYTKLIAPAHECYFSVLCCSFAID